MMKRIPFLKLINYRLANLDENNDNIKLLIDINSEKKYIAIFYKNISTDLQDIIDKSFDYSDPTILSPIGYFLENEEKDLVLIYNSLHLFSIQDYMTRDFLIAFKVSFGVCHSLLLFDKYINFKLSLILIDLQNEPRLLPFFYIQSNDFIEQRSNLNEYVNNFLVNINKKYQVLRNSDFFLTPFHQVILDFKLDKATFQNSPNQLSSKSDTFLPITFQSIYASFLNDLIPEIIELRKYHNQIHYIQSNFSEKIEFYSIFQQKNSSFNCLETVFLNKSTLIDRSTFELKPEDYLNFALLYIKGEIVSKNIDRALNLLMKASSLGESWFYIAICCLSDEKGNDRERATKFFKLGADKGHAESAFNYAKMTNSIDYFLKAAEGGVKDAFYQISRIYLSCGDVEKAMEFAEIGAERYKDEQCIKNIELIKYSLKIQEEKLIEETKRLLELKKEQNEEDENESNSSENENQNETNENTDESEEIKEKLIQKDEKESVENQKQEDFNETKDTNQEENIENNIPKEKDETFKNQNQEEKEEKTSNQEAKEETIRNQKEETISNQKEETINYQNQEEIEETIGNQKEKEEAINYQNQEEKEEINENNIQEEKEETFRNQDEIFKDQINIKTEEIKDLKDSDETIKNENETENDTNEVEEQSVPQKFELFQPNNGKSKFESIISRFQTMSIEELLHQTLFITNLIERSCTYCFIAFKFLEVNEIQSSRFYFEKSIDDMNYFTSENDYRIKNSNVIEFTDDHLLNTTDYSAFDKDLISYILSLSNFSLFKITGERKFLFESEDFPEISYELYKATRNKEYLIKAANMGHLKSMYKIGMIKEAAILGHSKSQFEYAKKILELQNNHEEEEEEEEDSKVKLAALYMKKAADSLLNNNNNNCFENKNEQSFVDHFLTLLKTVKTEPEPSINEASFYAFEYSKLIEKENLDESLKYLKMSAELNVNSESMLKYAFYLKSEKSDIEGFISYLKKSAACGSGEAYFQLAKFIMTNSESSKEFIEKVEKMIESEIESPKENKALKNSSDKLKEKAISFLFAASKLGSSNANLCLSRMMLHGFCVQKNERESMRLLKLAAKSDNNIEAKFHLAIATGDDQLLQTCCLKHYPPAMLEMAKKQIRTKNKETRDEGEKNLRFVSDNDNASNDDRYRFNLVVSEAQFELGSLLFSRQNYKESFAYLSRSIHYRRSSINTRNDLEDVKLSLLKKSDIFIVHKKWCKLINSALKMIALMLLNGRGVSPDEEEATKIFMAIDDDESKLQLAKIYMDTDPCYSLNNLKRMKKVTNESEMLKSILALKIETTEKVEPEKVEKKIDLDLLMKGKLNKPPENGFLTFLSNGPQFNQTDFESELNLSEFFNIHKKQQQNEIPILDQSSMNYFSDDDLILSGPDEDNDNENEIDDDEQRPNTNSNHITINEFDFDLDFDDFVPQNDIQQSRNEEDNSTLNTPIEGMISISSEEQENDSDTFDPHFPLSRRNRRNFFSMFQRIPPLNLNVDNDTLQSQDESDHITSPSYEHNDEENRNENENDDDDNEFEEDDDDDENDDDNEEEETDDNDDDDDDEFEEDDNGNDDDDEDIYDYDSYGHRRPDQRSEKNENELDDQKASEKVEENIEWTAPTGTECSRLLDIYSRLTNNENEHENENSETDNDENRNDNDNDNDNYNDNYDDDDRRRSNIHLSLTSENDEEYDDSNHIERRSSESLGTDHNNNSDDDDEQEDAYSDFVLDWYSEFDLF